MKYIQPQPHGMAWKSQPGNICFRFDFPKVDLPSKRIVLSILLVGRIYALLGLLSSITIHCKVLLQDMWIQKAIWDEALTDNVGKM